MSAERTATTRRPARAWVVVSFVLVALTLPSSAAPPEKVRAAIAKGKEFLYAKQNPDGSWDEPQPPSIKGNNQWGGPTALATYALLAGGESRQDPRVAKAIDWLVKADKMVGVYALGLRSQVWTFLPDGAQRRALLKRDYDWYIKGADRFGRFSYMADRSNGFYHNSTSQYGVLGLWAVARCGGEVPNSFWAACENGWKSCQGDDGGWGYKSEKPSGANEARATMTAAGIASLFVTQDYLHGNDGLRCAGNVTNANIEAGLNWMSKNYDPADANGYLLYGIERIGVASGRKYFGNRDWYESGSDALVRTQSKAGSWNYQNEVVGTAFGILFLSRGSAPVAINKLEYAVQGTRGRDKGKEVTARWNQRPRDVANVVRWIGENLERDLNWQVTSLAAPNPDDLLDAPILFISGQDTLEFTPEQKSRLKQYVVDGGMLLGHPDCGDKKFAESFHSVVQEMFPTYAFRPLPDSHVIFKGEQFVANNWKRKPQVEGLSNGVRELAILLPEDDVARSWQTLSAYRGREPFELAADLFLYSIDKQGLRAKGETHVVKRDDKVQSDRTVRVARLQYNGNWDPEPGGWKRLANVMHNRQRVELKVETVAIGSEAATPDEPATAPEDQKPTPAKKRGASPRGAQSAVPVEADATLTYAEARAAPTARPAATKPAMTQAWEPPVPPVPVAKAGGPLAGFTVAHLTGTGELKLTAEARENLKAFVDSGGTLVVDAAGGSAKFVESAERELTEALGGGAALRGDPIPADADVYNLWRCPISQFAYRRYAREHGVGKSNAPRLRAIKVGQRMAVFFSREDLSGGILGQQVDGVIGYVPETATEIMTNVILYAAGEVRDKPKHPATAPGATKPSSAAKLR